MSDGRRANVPVDMRTWCSALVLATVFACRADPQPAFAATTEAPAPAQTPAPSAIEPRLDPTRRSEASVAVAPASAAPSAHDSSTLPSEGTAASPGPGEIEPTKATLDLQSAGEDFVGPSPSSVQDAGLGLGDANERDDSPMSTEPRKVLIMGDSLAATGFGAVLEQKLDAHPQVHAYRKAKSASGLARPDFFDWMAEGKRQVEFRKPDLVVVIMGGNDGQDLTGKGEGHRVRWDTPEWRAAYAERVRAFVEEVHGSGCSLLWLGLPRTGTVKFERKLEIIREVQRSVVESRGPTATYLDTSPFLLDDDGALLREASVGARGRPQRLREDDGIHFTMGGSRFFAAKVYPAVLEALGLPNVDPEAD